MEVLANFGRYKIIEYIANEAAYQAFVAVNIEKSTNDEVLINRYRDAKSVRDLAPVIYETARAGGGEFIESFAEYGALCAVFTHKRGARLDKAVFLKKQDDATRLALAKSLMHNALLQHPYPLLVRNASLAMENVFVDIPNRLVFFRRMIRPDTDAAISHEQELLARYLPEIYKKDIFAPKEYWDFVEDLREGRFESISEMFSKWCVCAGILEQAIADTQKKGKLKRFIPGLIQWLKRKVWKKRGRAVKRDTDIFAGETKEDRNLGL